MPYSYWLAYIFFLDSYGDVYGDVVSVDETYGTGVWPTLYLTVNTKIVDGTGSINSPFVLS